jgi:nucleoside-diphosphate-sugar epimerase
MKIAMINILVTGGLGHIGSYACHRLIQNPNFNVTIVDDLSTQRYCSLFHLDRIYFNDKSFSEITIDELNEFDFVIHLAAKTNAAGSFDDNGATKYTNVDMTIDFINKVEKSNVKLFVFPSSTSVYGKNKEMMREDDDEILQPQSPYAESKLAIEQELRAKKLNYVILRFGTIFGVSPGMRFHTAINKFCYQAALNHPLTIWRQNMSHLRPYLGLCDAMTSIEMAIAKTDMWKGTYNVITDNYSVDHIITLINLIKKTKLSFVDTPLLNQHSYVVNCEKIEEHGYRPAGSICDSIKETMEMLSGIRH